MAKSNSAGKKPKPGFDYLEARITGTCAAQYSLVGMYETCRLVRIFDPNFASQYLDSAYVDSMAAITPLRSLHMLDQLKQEQKANHFRI